MPDYDLDPFSSLMEAQIAPGRGHLAARYVHFIVLGGAEESWWWGLQDTPSKGCKQSLTLQLPQPLLGLGKDFRDCGRC